MSMDFTVKPVGAPAPADFVRPPPANTPHAVATELPSPQSVAAAAPAANASNDPQQEAENLSRQVLFDRTTAEIVYRIVDNRTDRVVRQTPDQAMLRLRAYTRAASATPAEPQRKRAEFIV